MALLPHSLVSRWNSGQESPKMRVACHATGGASSEHEILVARAPERLRISGPRVLNPDYVGAFRCLVQPRQVNPSPGLRWRVRAGQESREFIGSAVKTVGDGRHEDVAADGSMLQISAAAVAGHMPGGRLPKDFVVECLAQHPENGKDQIAVAHVVKVYCKYKSLTLTLNLDVPFLINHCDAFLMSSNLRHVVYHDFHELNQSRLS